VEKNWDRIGACASAVCAVHCVLTASALGLLSVAGLSFLHHPVVEGLFLGATAVLGLWSVWHGRRRHGSWAPSTLFLLGLGLVLAKHFLSAHAQSGPLGIGLSLVGGASLVGFFVWNARLPHKACGCFAQTECAHEEHAEPGERLGAA
jgi:hypothetical protein